MNIDSAYPSKFLKAGELRGETVYTIKSVEIQELGSGARKETKPVVYFRECPKGLALNKTNKNVISGAYGSETTAWYGRQLILFPAQVEFQGAMVTAIRVRVRSAANPPPGARVTNQQPLSPATDAQGGDLNAAKAAAWRKWQAGRSGTREELVSALRKAATNYFEGLSPDLLSASQWSELAAGDFKRQIETPFGDENIFKEDDIPF